LRSAEFRKGREAGWRELDDMVGRVEARGVAALSAAEVSRLPLLYRAAVSSLAVARNIVLDRNLLLYLENLSLRAYLAVYGPRSGLLERLGGFFRQGWPGSVRGLRRHLAVAALAMLAGLAAGWLLVASDMSYFHMLVPEGLAGSRGPGSSAEDLRGALFAPWPGVIDTFVVFANSLFRHNAMVGILCFGLGFALGVPTLVLLIYNGMILGAFLALYASRGLNVDFIAWLSIHGVTELLAVLLCAAAGLAVAEKILFPGELPRLENLARHGRPAAGVVAGAVLMFFFAGLLEGGFRQLINNTPGRYAFALLTAAGWFWYFIRVGKRTVPGNGGGHGY
jgi:uncharacterized membrane protein SpoIIM required for sporulation